jgi:hypothetical protein
MRNKTIILVMLFLCVCSYLLGLFISGQKYEKFVVKPYLGDLSRNLIFVAILQNEDLIEPNDSIRLAYTWYRVAKSQGLESESIATWLKTYDSAYGLPSTIKLDSDIQNADSYIFKGEAKDSLLKSIEQALDIDNN